MADKYYKRLCFVMNICPEPLREFFIKLANKDAGSSYTTLDAYLADRQRDVMQLKMKKTIREDQYDLLYPGHGTADVEQWDVTLLLTLITEMFATRIQSLDEIRRIRNELQHLKNTSNMTDKDFDSYWGRLYTAAMTIAKQVFSAERAELFRKKIENAKSNNLPNLGDSLRQWYEESSNQIQSRLNKIESDTKESTSILRQVTAKKPGPSGYKIKRLKTADGILAKLQASFETTMNELPEDFSAPTEVADIQTKLRDNHYVVVTGSYNSRYFEAALEAIKGMDYNYKRSVEMHKFSDWRHIDPEDVDLVLYRNPFGSFSYDENKAKGMADIFNSMMHTTKEDGDRCLDIVMTTDLKILAECKQFHDHDILESVVKVLDDTSETHPVDPTLECRNQDVYSTYFPGLNNLKGTLSVVDNPVGSVNQSSTMETRRMGIVGAFNTPNGNEKPTITLKLPQAGTARDQGNSLIGIPGSVQNLMTSRNLFSTTRNNIVAAQTLSTERGDIVDNIVGSIDTGTIMESSREGITEAFNMSYRNETEKTIPRLPQPDRAPDISIARTGMPASLQSFTTSYRRHLLSAQTLSTESGGKKQAEKERIVNNAVSKSVLDNETISAEHTNPWKIDPNAWMQYLEEKNIENRAAALLQNRILPDNAVLNQICLMKTCSSNLVQTICHTICDFIKQKSSTISHVWSAYRYRSVKPGLTHANRNVIFAVITSQSVKIDEFETYQRCVDEISDKCQTENDAVYLNQQHSMLEGEELCKLQKCVRENARYLMKKHSNLTKVAASWIKASGFGGANTCMKEIPCITMYVHIKDLVPINEEPFAETIGGFPTDVREGVFTLCGKPNDLHQNVKMGCEIDSGFGTNQGTIGPFFQFETDRNIYYLTSAHVVLNPSQIKTLKKSQDGCIYYGICGTETFQPPESQSVVKENKRHNLGKIELAVYKEGTRDEAGMEIALVLINDDRVPNDGSFPDNININMNEFGPGNHFHYSSGKIFEMTKLTHTTALYKFGSTTGLTKGRCLVHGTSVRRNQLQDSCYGCDITLHNQIEIESFDRSQPFAKQGDSGSLVLARDGEHLAAVGIFEGMINGSYMVTPIEDIVSVLSESLSRYRNQPRRSANEMEVEEFSIFKPIKLHFRPPNTQSTANQQITDEVTKQTSNLETNIIQHVDHNINTVKSELTTIKQQIDNTGMGLKQHINEMEGRIAQKIDFFVDHRGNM